MIEVDITTLTYGGSGLGHVDGKAVFVAGAIPGDRVRCKVVQDKKRYAKAQLVEVLTPSAQRRTPPCEYFAECGGCDWQQLSYDDQCDWKQRLFVDSCQRQLNLDAARILPLVVSPKEMGYRSRIQLKCCNTVAGFMIGFYRRGSHAVVNVNHCLVIDPAIDALITPLRQLFDGTEYAAAVPQIDIAVGDADGLVGDDGAACRIIVHYNGREQSRGRQQSAFCDWLRRRISALDAAVLVQGGRKSPLTVIQGEAELTIEVDEPPLALNYGPGGFAQINLAQNRQLVEMVKQRAALQGDETVLDLYCGMGNFSLPLARRSARVVGVEGYTPSIDSARANARRHAIDNCSFFAEPVERFLRRWHEAVDVVVLDPPRSGAKEAVVEILRCSPQRIVYVSCDQQTLMRDLGELLKGPYRLESIRAVDMFPQTCHTEVVALLERKS
ncbi:MAG: 23S rRNA (uracil(1939)-C(5))-methyltransferase RlmD [Desulfuromonas sp.]|nr:23S rRNA (uracil(1939)-C(5))-methyltransferase RlmD [Desulfuromonas sp.]